MHEVDQLLVKERLEQHKRGVLETAMNKDIPKMAEINMESAAEMARRTLEDIQQGNNPDLEPIFRQKMEELGIKI